MRHSSRMNKSKYRKVTRARRPDDSQCGRHRWKWPWWCKRQVFHSGPCALEHRLFPPIEYLVEKVSNG